MPEILRVAAVQLNSCDDVSTNLTTCRRLIGAASSEGARLVVLPENFAFMGKEAGRRTCVERLDGPAGPIRSMLFETASLHGIYLVAGGWPLASDDEMRPFNAASIVTPSGGFLATYRKIHLFDVDAPDGISYRESRGVTAGSVPICATVDGFRVGLSICYDLRFPELYRKLVDMGAEIICIPAAFTAATGRAHWEVLCRARAIESQCYVIAPGQTGAHRGGRETYGHSLVVDPWGEILADAGDHEGIVVVNVDRTRIGSVREKLPCLQHRRL
jgi:deaminated glutathione amidase